MKCIRLLFLAVVLLGCKQYAKPETTKGIRPDTLAKEPTAPNKEMASPVEIKSLEGLADTMFIRLAEYSPDFLYDLRYATENNFLKAKVYDCAECYTRVRTARSLIAANKDFMARGYRILFFDCYRPRDVQYKMWEIVPNPQYVADPRKGSIHNKGGAVDITLATLEGEVLDMGTDFDFFGRKAYHDNLDLPETILNNRRILKETMESHGFWSIRTEWWHYNLGAASNYPVANFKWECDE